MQCSLTRVPKYFLRSPAMNLGISKEKVLKYAINSKCPSKYCADFCPEVGITGIVSLTLSTPSLFHLFKVM
jgi:hypothetical protein